MLAPALMKLFLSSSSSTKDISPNIQNMGALMNLDFDSFIFDGNFELYGI